LPRQPLNQLFSRVVGAGGLTLVGALGKVDFARLDDLIGGLALSFGGAQVLHPAVLTAAGVELLLGDKQLVLDHPFIQAAQVAHRQIAIVDPLRRPEARRVLQESQFIQRLSQELVFNRIIPQIGLVLLSKQAAVVRRNTQILVAVLDSVEQKY